MPNPKKIQDKYLEGFSQDFLPFELGLFRGGLGEYADSWRNAMGALSPSQTQGRIDEFRNNQLQTAARMGQQAALNAAWSGFGSGSRESLINAAMQNAGDNIGDFVNEQYSPEMAMRRMAGMRSLYNPLFMNQSQQFSTARKGAHPSGGALGNLGGLLQGAAQYAAMGGFGGVAGI